MATVVTTAAGVLGFMATWSALDLPRPAFTTDLRPISEDMAGLKAFSRDSRLLILNGDWWRYEAQLQDVELAIQAEPGDHNLLRLRQRLRQAQAQIQSQINALKK